MEIDKQTKKALFNEMLQFRHACKIFDESKKISEEDLEFILNAGRMSPSSFGMEHWKFLVIENQELKEKIFPLTRNQKQILTCSHLVVILAKKYLKSDEEYVKQNFERWNLPEDLLEVVLSRYKNAIDNLTEEQLTCWSMKQCYIAATNMMNAAACIGIDSCPMEGFIKEDVEKLLNIDTSKYEVAMLLPFGYRIKEQPQKFRRDLKELVEYIK